MWRHYVYVHRRADDERVFYVGKGTVRGRSRVERAFDHANRNAYWRRTVAKHGLVVELVASFITDADAQIFERQLIAEYGRASLVNLTDGGDGCAGIVPAAETRRKLSEAAKRKRTPAWVAAIRRARKGGGNGGVVKAGDRLPAAWKARIAAGKVGAKNPMYGKQGPRARAVISDGIEYPSVSAAAQTLGIPMKTLYNMLSGHRPNATGMRFAR